MVDYYDLKYRVEKWKSLSRVQLFVTPWTVQSTEFFTSWHKRSPKAQGGKGSGNWEAMLRERYENMLKKGSETVNRTDILQ